MTQEQKAIAYDKAIEKIKYVIEHGVSQTLDKEDLQDLFPELKESEDERIRKSIIHLVNISHEHGGYALSKDEAEEMLAWLEKQGEKPKKVSIWKHWKDGIAGNGEGKQIYLIKAGNTYNLSSCLCFECDYIELSELDNLLVEKQAPKSKWTDEDDYNVQCCIAKAESDIANGNLGRNKILIDWLNKLNDRFHQGINDVKKSKWTEEDEENLKSIDILLFEYKNMPKEKYWKMIDWIKTIKKRMEE